MSTMIPIVLILVLWTGAIPATTQLPPEIMADRYLVEAEQLIAKKEFGKALGLMNKIVVLQQEHHFKLPDVFHFKYARVALSAGSIKVALESVNRYLVTAGREGERYREALELSIKMKSILDVLGKYPDRVDQLMAEKDYAAALDLMGQIEVLQKEHEFTLPAGFHAKYTEAQFARAVEQPCMGQPKGTECWMELSNQPGCYVQVRNPSWPHYKKVTWTGGCSGGLAQGTGKLKWTWNLDVEPLVQAGSSSLLRIKLAKPKNCYFLLLDADSWLAKRRVTWKGKCAGGLAQGMGTLKFSTGRKSAKQNYEYKGQFQAGKRQGNWVERRYWKGSEDITKAQYVNGKRHGRLVSRSSNGGVQQDQYVNGKRHGRSTSTWRGGSSSGFYIHGFGIHSRLEITVEEGRYEAGKRHGRWVQRSR